MNAAVSDPTLSDDELVTQMHEDLYDGLGPEIINGRLAVRV